MKKSILVACVAALFANNALANDDAPMLSMANPAATYCIDQGGQTKSVKTEDGEHGICILSDGSEVEQWEYFRQNQDAQGEEVMVGMANPASVYCEEQGGSVKIIDTTDGQVGMCIMKDGSEIEEWEFFNKHNK